MTKSASPSRAVTGTTGALEGLQVLDLADPRSGLCARLLADLGAEVTRPAPARATPSTPPCPTGPVPGLDLDRAADRNRLRTLIDRAEVVIETGPPGWLDGFGLGPDNLDRTRPDLILVSITGFGQTGSRRNWKWCDLIASASGGQAALTGQPTGRPTKLPGPQVYNLASLNAAIGVLLALKWKQTTGQGQAVDISLQECAAAGLDHVLPRYLESGEEAARLGSAHWNDSFLTLPGRDGFLHLAPFQLWKTLVNWLAADGQAADLADEKYLEADYRRAHLDHISRVIGAWSSNYDRDELVATAQLMGLPAAPCAERGEVLACPQLNSRNFWLDPDRPGETARPSYLVQPGPEPECGPGNLVHGRLQPLPSAPPRSPLAGLTVLDFSRVLAGPYATRLLADFGAKVIKVQTGRLAHGVENNQSAYFRLYHRNKRGVTIDLSRPQGREVVLELAAKCDVVVENFSPRVMDNWNLGYDALSRVRPDIILLHMSAMGQTGPWRDRVAFGPTLHALSGLTALTDSLIGPGQGPPAGPGFAFSDIAAGLHGALAVLAALEHRRRTGRGACLDLSEYETLVGLVAPWLDRSRPPRSNPAVALSGDPPAAPYGCYPCAGPDRWLALAAFDQAQWSALCRVLGLGELTADPRFATLEARLKNNAQLDELIGRATAAWAAPDLAEALQAAGLASAEVQTAPDLAADPHLAARNFLVRLEGAGRAGELTDNTPIRLGRGGAAAFWPAPDLGQGNQAVFRHLLGWSQAKLAEMIDQGVIA